MEISVENRKLMNEEAKRVASAQKPRVYRLDEREDDSDVDQDVLHKSKLMNYSIQQYEDWAEKQREKNVKREGGDMSNLAKYTYEKELKTLKSEVPYKKHAHKVEKRPTTAISPITRKLTIHDDSDLVHRLARGMDKTAKDRYSARRREIQKTDIQSAKGGFINEKNKQFNEKLDRQLAREESD